MVTKIRDVVEVDVSPTMMDAASPQYDPCDSESLISAQLLTRNLILFTVLKTVGSFDSGAFSAALGAENGIAEEWGLSTIHQGTLTSSVFLGNILGCPLSGHLFSRYSAKMVLIWSLALHTLFTFFFATLTEYRIALLCRFLIGITLSFVIVYTPVWVDIFAPRDRQSVWMASHNAGVPLGIMLGYCLGAFLPSYTNINWEWAFYIKCIITIPAVAYLARVDSRSIDRRITVGYNNRSDSITSHTATTVPRRRAAERIFDILHSNVLYMWRTCVPLFYNTEYMCSTLTMCSLYFVVTGLQNFVTQYLRDEPFRASMKTIMLGFGGAVVTAPVLGVITGGVLLDRIGGYQRNLRRVALFTFVWGAAAAFFSVMCIFITNTEVFLLVISIVLFCGGAIVPSGSGTVVASVPEPLRPLGAAFSQMMYNLLGNFSGPMVCGVVADLTGELKYGIYTVLSCSVVGLIPLVVLLRKAYSVSEPLDTPLSIISCTQPRQQQAMELAEEVVVMGMSGIGGMTFESPRTDLRDDSLSLLDNSNAFYKENNRNGTLSQRVRNSIGDVGTPTGMTAPTTETLRMYVNTAPQGSFSILSSHLPPLSSAANTSSQTTPITTTATRGRAPHIAMVDNGITTSRTSITDALPTFSSHPLLPTSAASLLCGGSEGGPAVEQWAGGYRSTVTENRNTTNCTSHTHRMSFSNSCGSRHGCNEEEEQDEENFCLELESDAAQMMSFPNQHNFGLDMLRSWLNSSLRGHSSSRQSSLHAMQSLISDAAEFEDVDGVRDECFVDDEERDADSRFPMHPPPREPEGGREEKK